MCDSYCSGNSYTYLIKTYDRGSEKLALRCGTSSWGFNHITARWNSTFDSEMALTISRIERVDDYQGDGRSAIYALFDVRCNEIFRVIYNGRVYNGNGVSPQGIITAYERSGTITTAVPNTASTNATPATELTALSTRTSEVHR